MFYADKTRMIGLPYGEKNYDNMLSRFHPIPERYWQTDGRTDGIPISISRVSMLMRDKKTLTQVTFSNNSNKSDPSLIIFGTKNIQFNLHLLHLGLLFHETW